MAGVRTRRLRQRADSSAERPQGGYGTLPPAGGKPETPRVDVCRQEKRSIGKDRVRSVPLFTEPLCIPRGERGEYGENQLDLPCLFCFEI